jgi:hypothetical protein
VTASPDTIHQRGREALLAGRELLDDPPVPGATRWGLSLVARPDAAAADRLDALAVEAAGVAGPGQWLTGGRGSAHITVTYLERLHREVGADDPQVRRYAALVREVAARTQPLRWQVTGLALADRGVLALATPADDADAFRGEVLARLGGLGAEEGNYRQSVWWSTLLHFAAPVAHRNALVAWVDARESLPPLPVTATSVDVVRYAYDGVRTVPVTLASAELTGG